MKTEQAARLKNVAENLYCLINGGFSSNTYFVEYSPGYCFIVDPGLDVPAIFHAIDQVGWKATHVLLTHGHFDHVGCASKIQKTFDIPVHLHKADHKVAKSANFLMMACKVEGRIGLPIFSEGIEGGESKVKLGEEVVSFFNVPGHTPGSCCIYFKGLLFTGDTLYARSVSLVALPGEKPDLLAKSVVQIFEKYGDDDMVLPGHGPSSELKIVREKNLPLKQFLSERVGAVGFWSKNEIESPSKSLN